jgi:hypothetical protein
VKIGVIGCEPDATHDEKTFLTIKYGKAMGMTEDECRELIMDVGESLAKETNLRKGIKEKLDARNWFK